MSKVDEQSMPLLNKGEYCFKDDHPGKWYFCIKKTKKMRVPKLSLPNRMICDLEDLAMSEETPSKQAFQFQENYVKVALVLFILFITIAFFLFRKINACGKNDHTHDIRSMTK